VRLGNDNCSEVPQDSFCTPVELLPTRCRFLSLALSLSFSWLPHMSRARARTSLVYVGIKTHVLALDRNSGMEVWRTLLPAKYRSSGSLVNVVRDAEGLFATCAGEIFALDPRDGSLLWHEPLKGLGYGLTTVATDLGGSTPLAALAESQRQAQAAAARAAAT